MRRSRFEVRVDSPRQPPAARQARGAQNPISNHQTSRQPPRDLQSDQGDLLDLREAKVTKHQLVIVVVEWDDGRHPSRLGLVRVGAAGAELLHVGHSQLGLKLRRRAKLETIRGLKHSTKSAIAVKRVTRLSATEVGG